MSSSNGRSSESGLQSSSALLTTAGINLAGEPVVAPDSAATVERSAASMRFDAQAGDQSRLLTRTRVEIKT